MAFAKARLGSNGLVYKSGFPRSAPATGGSSGSPRWYGSHGESAMSAARSFASMAVASAVGLAAVNARAATLAAHTEVRGADLETADVRAAGGAWRSMAWGDLARTTLAPGRYQVRVRFVSDRPGQSIQ